MVTRKDQFNLNANLIMNNNLIVKLVTIFKAGMEFLKGSTVLFLKSYPQMKICNFYNDEKTFLISTSYYLYVQKPT